MGFSTIFKWNCILLVFFSLSSCCELPSDEELREDIIGTWNRSDCKHPHNTESQDATQPSPLRLEMTFYPDGRFTEGGGSAYCTLDTCDSIWLDSDCRCQWEIQDGKLFITSLATSSSGHLNKEYPIKCLRNDLLVFDNHSSSFQGSSGTVTKACYNRQ